MNRRPFTESPEAWMRASRTGQSRIDYACPVQRQRAAKSDRTLLVLFIFACGAMLLGVI
jgi:hypothetical protein